MPDLPGHDRRADRRAMRGRRRITYTRDEEERGEIELELPERRPEPPVEVQGEPWGWTKAGPKPRGWPGPDHRRDEPGPFDGSWDPSGEDRQ